MDYLENSLSFEDYHELRSSVGWNNFDEEQTKRCIGGSLYTVSVVERQQTVAMGRLIGDGMYYLIADVVVRPEYQGKGIGGKVVDMLIAYADKATPVGGRTSIQLIAMKGKEEFYIKKGFKLIPHENCGSGMRKIIRK